MAYPKLDPRSVEDVVAQVINDLPSALTDRGPASTIVKTVEACGAIFSGVLHALNLWPKELELKIYDILGIKQNPATAAVVDVQFTAVSSDGATVPAGTLVKTGTGIEAIEFTTDQGLQPSDFADNGQGVWVATVRATAIEAGLAGNVPAGEVKYITEPISGIEGVTNPAASFGGRDIEPIGAMLDRAPLATRLTEYAITHEEFRYHASQMGGVARAFSIGGPGFVNMHLLADDLNAEPSQGLCDQVRDELLARTVPGVTVTCQQSSIRLVRFPVIEAELWPGEDAEQTARDVEDVLRRGITAVDLYAEDFYTKIGDAWAWGRPLYLNWLIAVLPAAKGIRRVEKIHVQWSDDYGATWDPPEGPVDMAGEPESSVPAAADGQDGSKYGLLHYSGEPVTILPLT